MHSGFPAYQRALPSRNSLRVVKSGCFRVANLGQPALIDTVTRKKIVDKLCLENKEERTRSSGQPPRARELADVPHGISGSGSESPSPLAG